MINKIQLHTAYVLHTRAYQESSLLVELLTPQGRLSVMAKGAKRPKSMYRGILQPFIPLTFSCSGSRELKTLTYAEVKTHVGLLQNDYLLAGLYVNELLMRLLLKESPCGLLFNAYETVLAALFQQQDLHICLRLFEKNLLKFLGYELNLTHDAQSQEAINPDAQYIYVLDQGPVQVMDGNNLGNYIFCGKTFLDLAQENLIDAKTRQQVKQLLRQALQVHLGAKPLTSRQLLLQTSIASC
jgi:DNA repair protein RecO (recombination protein O)